MNTDIRIKTSFFRNLKTKKLEKKVGSEGVLALIKLWLYTAEYKSNGLLDLTEEDILLICETDNKDLVNIFIELEFIDVEPNGYKIHDWEEHNGYASQAQSRSNIARKAAAKRWEKISNALSNAPSMLEQCSSNAQSINKQCSSNAHFEKSNAPTPSPIPYPYPYPSPVPNPIPDVCINATSNENPLFINQKEKIPKAIIRSGETTAKKEIDKIMSNILKKQEELNAIN